MNYFTMSALRIPGIATFALILTVFLPILASAADVTLQPNQGTKGTEVTAKGAGWRAGIEVWTYFENQIIGGPAIPDASGGFTTKFCVPDRQAGVYPVYFIDGRNTWGPPFTITSGTPGNCQSTSAFQINDNFYYAGWSAHPSSNPVTKVEGQWIVPAVDCQALNSSRPWWQSRAAPWVGIWGKPPLVDEKTWLPQIGTASVCAKGGQSQPPAFNAFRYKAVVQLMHKGSLGPAELFDVQPGDLATASVSYYGRRADNTLLFEAAISVTDPNGRVRDSRTIPLQTDPGVSVDDAAWQGGCIVENEPDVQGRVSPDDPNVPRGGLARFTTPIQFSRCTVNGKGLATYSSDDTLIRWDMKWDKKPDNKLADTGLLGQNSQFSVTPMGKPPPLAVRLEKALPFRRWVAARASCGGATCPRPHPNPKHNAESDGQEAHHTMRKSAKRGRGATYASQPQEGCPLLHPLQGASCLSTPLQGGILKPPALRVVDDFGRIGILISLRFCHRTRFAKGSWCTSDCSSLIPTATQRDSAFAVPMAHLGLRKAIRFRVHPMVSCNIIVARQTDQSHIHSIPAAARLLHLNRM